MLHRNGIAEKKTSWRLWRMAASASLVSLLAACGGGSDTAPQASGTAFSTDLTQSRQGIDTLGTEASLGAEASAPALAPHRERLFDRVPTDTPAPPSEAAPAPAERLDATATTAVTAGASTSVTYSPDNSTIFPNPERGFYASSDACQFTLTRLISYRTNQSVSLVFCDVNLRPFINASIDAATLNNFNNAMALVRQAGLKVIVRFAYSWTSNAQPRDTTKAWMLTHIGQLKPLLQSNSDVITTLQAGFIGIWGEWYYTDYFGSNGVISAAQWADRQEVLQALLDALPASRTVQVRTPAFKKRFYGTAPLTATEAFSNTYKARVGQHNDCFLANANDYGTYVNVTADKAYLTQDNLYVPQGGETCAVSSYSKWNNANKDMTTLHYSYLNKDYNTSVLQSWGSNINIAKRKLGYRFALTQGEYSNAVPSGATLNVNFTVRNDGYAAPYNARSVDLVLRNTSTGAIHTFRLNTDPRRWAPGTSSVVSQSVALTGVPAGAYALLLNLADPSPALAGRPEYAIRLANTGGLWEAGTGFNALKHTVTVTGP
jgi:hypothetical protein